MTSPPAIRRAEAFCRDYGLRLPILMAPMAGACPPALAAAVASAGGMGACGCLVMPPDQIGAWAAQVRAASNGAFQLNIWVPDPAPERDPAHEAALRGFLADWGPEVPADAPDMPMHDFDAQCAAMLEAGPPVISSIMGLYPPGMVAEMKARGIRWFATATTLAEARAAAEAGADAIIAQGMEAGGHRGAFEADHAEQALVGGLALIPAVADAVDVPVIAAGGIADGRAVAAALLLGASAVVVGTALLRSPEAAIAPSWAEAIGRAAPEETRLTRAFSGRLGRSLRTDYTDAAGAPGAPRPAPFPVQAALTGGMRAAAVAENRLAGLSAWAGQSARLATARPAAETVTQMWASACDLLAPPL